MHENFLEGRLIHKEILEGHPYTLLIFRRWSLYINNF